MNTSTCNRIVLVLAVPTLAAAAWITAGLEAVNISPFPPSEAIALPDGELPIPSAEIINASGGATSEDPYVTGAKEAWGENWESFWQNVVALSENIDSTQKPLPAQWIKDIHDGNSKDCVKKLQENLEIRSDVKDEYNKLEQLSGTIDTLLGDDAESLGKICLRYISKLDSFEKWSKPKNLEINDAIPKNEKPLKKETAVASKEPPKQSAPTKQRPGATTKKESSIKKGTGLQDDKGLLRR